ncbi:MAG: DNA-binding protein [Candidatus Aenigmarchaeota archaeon]|nr:DNA-binding protein [Candidatus Aenigmarchaeota archaeon]
MSQSLDEIRKKRMAELQAQAASQNFSAQQETANQMAQLEAELRTLMPKLLDAKAMERLSMIKSTKPDFAIQVQLYLVSAYRQGQIKNPIDDDMFRQILDSIVQKPKWNIRRK